MTGRSDTERFLDAFLAPEADELSDRVLEAALSDIARTPQRRALRVPWRFPKMPVMHRAAAAALALVVLVGAAGVFYLNSGGFVGGPNPTATPTPSPTPSASPTVTPPTPGRMWPQSTDEEVRQAQQLADAGDPAYTWQVDPDLYSDVNLTTSQIIDRFLREVLGWDVFLYTVHQLRPELSSSQRSSLVYVRCAADETNSLYPTADENAPGADRCAPTIDDLRYETVRFNLDQPEQKGPTGIWVIGEWAMIAPLTQVDPSVAKTEVTAQLEAWLAARIAGEGAEGTVDVDDGLDSECRASFCRIDGVPLLYATTSGAPYERYVIERVGGPRWPYAEMDFKVRLFADEGATMVEQPISWIDPQPLKSRASFRLLSNVTQVTENGRPVAVQFGFLARRTDLPGALTASAARPWVVSHPDSHVGLRLRDEPGGVRIAFVPDPRPFDAGCQAGPAPAGAAALAQSIRSSPTFEATAPVDVIVGSAEGLYMDVTLAPGASVCPDEDGHFAVVTSSLPYPYPIVGWDLDVDPGIRMRLYLFDLPSGSSMPILAIAIVAPESTFERAVELAAPVVNSIQFHAP